jgi:hypothetical protein
MHPSDVPRAGHHVVTFAAAMSPRPWIVLPNDPVQRLEDNLRGVAGLFFRLMGGKLGGPGLHPVQKRLADRPKLREHLLGRIIPGHGAVIESGAAEVLRALD